jgi:sulfur carrier protein ThiS
MHANNVDARDALEKERATATKGGKRGDDRSPAHTWKSYLYHDGESLIVPLENMLAMLIAAGKKVKVQGKETLKTYTTLIDFEQQDVALMVDGKPVKMSTIAAIKGDFDTQREAAGKLGFRLDVRPVRVGQSSHIRVRPTFDRWSLEGTFAIDSTDIDVLTRDRLELLFAIAGKRCGLLDWRPNAPTPGRFGRFAPTIEAI